MGKPRVSLSLQQRAQVVAWSEQGLTGQKIVDRVSTEYGLKVDKSTINKMLKKKEFFKELAAQNTNDKAKRQRVAKWPALEAALLVWFDQVGGRSCIRLHLHQASTAGMWPLCEGGER